MRANQGRIEAVLAHLDQAAVRRQALGRFLPGHACREPLRGVSLAQPNVGLGGDDQRLVLAQDLDEVRTIAEIVVLFIQARGLRRYLQRVAGHALELQRPWRQVRDVVSVHHRAFVFVARRMTYAEHPHLASKSSLIHTGGETAREEARCEKKVCPTSSENCHKSVADSSSSWRRPEPSPAQACSMSAVRSVLCSEIKRRSARLRVTSLWTCKRLKCSISASTWNATERGFEVSVSSKSTTGATCRVLK